MAARRGRPIFLIDIAMPRDVEASVHELESVYLYTLEDLQGIVRENLGRREAEVAAARRLVAEKASEFERWLADVASGALPTFKHSLSSPIGAPE
jgi:glutamyl-tRNA reductase